MLKIVIDTNIWIRALLAGPVTLPVLEAWLEKKFQVLISQPLLDELQSVCQRPRLKKYIKPNRVESLIEQLLWRAVMVSVTTVPPYCRDPKDNPVLATAIDGRADAIVSGDADLRADDKLRLEMESHGIKMWGVNALLEKLASG